MLRSRSKCYIYSVKLNFSSEVILIAQLNKIYFFQYLIILIIIIIILILIILLYLK